MRATRSLRVGTSNQAGPFFRLPCPQFFFERVESSYHSITVSQSHSAVLLLHTERDNSFCRPCSLGSTLLQSIKRYTLYHD